VPYLKTLIIQTIAGNESSRPKWIYSIVLLEIIFL